MDVELCCVAPRQSCETRMPTISSVISAHQLGTSKVIYVAFETALYKSNSSTRMDTATPGLPRPQMCSLPLAHAAHAQRTRRAARDLAFGLAGRAGRVTRREEAIGQGARG